MRTIANHISDNNENDNGNENSHQVDDGKKEKIDSKSDSKNNNNTKREHLKHKRRSKLNIFGIDEHIGAPLQRSLVDANERYYGNVQH